MAREFDFGFSLVDETELDAINEAQDKVKKADINAMLIQERLDNLYNTIQPLLNNLKANPEKEYVYWPDRARKVEEFSDVLDEIYHGEY